MSQVKSFAWRVFAEELRKELAQDPSLTHVELANRLGMDSPSRVRNWVGGRSIPQIDEFADIVRAVNRDRPGSANRFNGAGVLEKMGLLDASPDETTLFHAGHRMLRLSQKLSSARRDLAALESSARAALVVQAAVASENWSVTVTPVVSGPSERHRFRVSDDLVIEPLPHSRYVDQSPWLDRQMREALRRAYAVPRSSSGDGRHREPPRWRILNLGAPTVALSPQSSGYSGQIFVMSTTRSSWVSETAGVVAMLLGLGLETTRDLAMEVSGIAYDKTRVVDRWSAFREYAADPDQGSVVAHYGHVGATEADILGYFRRTPPSRSLVVVLDEDDRVLQESLVYASENVGDLVQVDKLQAARDRLRRQASELGEDRALVLKVKHGATSPEKWRQTLKLAVATVEWVTRVIGGMDTSSLEDVRRANIAHDQRLAKPIYQWIDLNTSLVTRVAPFPRQIETRA